MDRIELNVTINGTGINPWQRFGLRQNPFPQTGKAQYAAGERKLASLDGDPVRTADDIRERLAGFDPAVVEGIIQRWQPGHRVRFKIVFPGGRNTAGPSRELSAGAGRALVRGGLNEVRASEHGTRPCPHPAQDGAVPGRPLRPIPWKEPDRP